MTTSNLPGNDPSQSYRYLDLITALFVTILVVSNIASSAKIVDWGFSILGVRLAFDAALPGLLYLW
jgi:hypothetical protein